MGDEAIGLEALRMFRERFGAPEGVELLDEGTLGLQLLAHLEGCQRLLVADCAELGGPAGEVARLGAEDVEPAFSRCLSPHEMGLNDLLGALVLLGERPRDFAVIGMEPERIEPGLELSEPAQAALPAMVEAMAEELRSWGIRVERRDV
jgi:hydrogenase maturation protease